MKGNKSLFIFLIICINVNIVSAKLPNENGYKLWLRYAPVADKKFQEYKETLSNIFISSDVSTAGVIAEELKKGLSGMLGITPTIHQAKETVSFLHISTKQGDGISNKDIMNIGKEGYIIKSVQRRNNKIILIKSAGDAGLLYGTFHLLRLIQTQQPLDNIHVTEKPQISLRMLNHWDNLDGSVERGYSGASIFKWNDLTEDNLQRIKDYARANASIGINAAVLNNVNADPRILREDYLEKVAKVADILRPYNIRIFLSANYAAPLPPSATPDVLKKWGGIGHLATADPVNGQVKEWWKVKVKEIYKLIPDFGGFLVKANSEGMPGPQDYGRSHVEGANMLARLLHPYGGILIWRAFVYAHNNREPDRAKQSYAEFQPLDGKFDKNVILQVKNGPLDFQPLEPPHPLFGALEKTNLFAELQITQEYLGHSNYLVYLAPMWKDFLNFENHQQKIAHIISKKKAGRVTGIAGVANVGDDQNWTGHHFAQANWYAFGRLAWNPDLYIDSITNDWLKMTFSLDASGNKKLLDIMNASWIRFADLQTPMGLPVTTDPGMHYYPALKQRANMYWKINAKGIGYDRTTSGSGYANQYDGFNKQRFNNKKACPEEYLLFFHFVDWNYRLQNRKTLLENLLQGFQQSINSIDALKFTWQSFKDQVDQQRYKEVQQKIDLQKKDALEFKNYFVGFLNTFLQ